MVIKIFITISLLERIKLKLQLSKIVLLYPHKMLRKYYMLIVAKTS